MKMKAFKIFGKTVHVGIYTAQRVDDAKEAGILVNDENKKYVWFYKLPHVEVNDNGICKVYDFRWLKYGIKIMILHT